MQSSLVNFIQVLRTHDVRISPAETLDAVDVAATLGYSDRSLLRDGLAMTLAKTPEEEVIFLHCFDRFFQQELARFFQRRHSPRPRPMGKIIAASGRQTGRRRISALPGPRRCNWPPKPIRHCKPCCKRR